MNGKQEGLLVAGDYGASDEESDSEDVKPANKENVSKFTSTVIHSSVDGSQINANYESQGKWFPRHTFEVKPNILVMEPYIKLPRLFLFSKKIQNILLLLNMLF